MPHVPRPLLLRIDAPADAVRAVAERELGLTPGAGGRLTGPLSASPSSDARLLVDVRPREEDHTTEVELSTSDRPRLPYFEWLIGPLMRVAQRRSLRYQAQRLEAAVNGRAPPQPPRPSPLLPPVPFTTEAAVLLATVAAVAAL